MVIPKINIANRIAVSDVFCLLYKERAVEYNKYKTFKTW